MNVRKHGQAVDREYQEKEMSNGIVSESACDDLCLGVVAATAKASRTMMRLAHARAANDRETLN